MVQISNNNKGLESKIDHQPRYSIKNTAGEGISIVKETELIFCN
jgi:hypothetical protein